MLKIAICDDTREERELVEQYAKRYFDARKQPAEFEIFHSMQDVLDTGRAYDLYLLDVLMPGKSGIQGAADLLKLYADPVLFQVPQGCPEYTEAQRLLKFLDYFLPVDPHDVPLNSILREFIGGGILLN